MECDDTRTVHSGAEISLSVAVAERRATRHYDSAPVAEGDLHRSLAAGLAAPSAYNLQPWRFVVVRDPEQRKRLREAAMGQSKVEEAPVVIVACGDTQGWKNGDLEDMLRLATHHSYGGPAQSESARRNVATFLGGMPGTLGGVGRDLAVWMNRHVMIAFTTMIVDGRSVGL